MSRNLVNLLPGSRIRAFRRGYFFRLATVALGLLAVVIVIHTVLLLPSFLYLGAEQSSREEELARLANELSVSAGDAANQELAAFTQDAAHLSRLRTLPTASGTLRAVLAAPRAGIALTGITYAPPSGDAANGKVTLSGMAGSRESLRAYERALREVAGVDAVELPIGAYAKVSEIDFTVTLTGDFMP